MERFRGLVGFSGLGLMIFVGLCGVRAGVRSTGLVLCYAAPCGLAPCVNGLSTGGQEPHRQARCSFVHGIIHEP